MPFSELDHLGSAHTFIWNWQVGKGSRGVGDGPFPREEASEAGGMKLTVGWKKVSENKRNSTLRRGGQFGWRQREEQPTVPNGVRR